MPFISRDDNGNINGAFAVEQYPGQEYLEDDNPEYLAWLDAIRNPPPPPFAQTAADQQLFQSLERLQLNFGLDLRTLLVPTLVQQVDDLTTRLNALEARAK